jgi:S-ribosylhomocysteine lyase LuxS involved in autoinducer biosynthesis
VAYFDIVATGPQGQRTIDHVIVKARMERQEVADWTASAWIKALSDE